MSPAPQVIVSPRAESPIIDEGEWTCAYCSMQFIHKTTLLDHMAVEHGATNQAKCKICSKVYSSPETLKVHMQTHNTPQRFQCEICDKRFTTKRNYLGHMNVHSGAKPHRCVKCLKGFSHASNLTRHMATCNAKFFTDFASHLQFPN